MIAVLTVAVVGGITYGFSQFEADVASVSTSSSRPSESMAAERETSPSADPTPVAEDSSAPTTEETAPYEAPTFDLLEPTDGRAQPVVLLVGDGYAAGRGASNAGTSYASLLSTRLDWDIRLATAPGAGLVAGTRLLDLFADSPASVDPDLVIIQGGYGGDGSNVEAKTAIAELSAAIEQRYPDAVVVAVSPFWPGTPTKLAETRERTVARAWREDPDVLVLRPEPDGWSDFTTVNGAPDDAGHELIATSMIEAFRDSGLAPPA